MTTRRGFLQAILAAGVAPYVSTTAGVLMPVKRIATQAPGAGAYVGAYEGIDRATYFYWRPDVILTGEEVHKVLESVWREATRGGPALGRLL